MKFTTSQGTTIPSAVMLTVRQRLNAGEDWQRVANEELREWIPEHDEDLSEVNEVLSECEQ